MNLPVCCCSFKATSANNADFYFFLEKPSLCHYKSPVDDMLSTTSLVPGKLAQHAGHLKEVGWALSARKEMITGTRRVDQRPYAEFQNISTFTSVCPWLEEKLSRSGNCATSINTKSVHHQIILHYKVYSDQTWSFDFVKIAVVYNSWHWSCTSKLLYKNRWWYLIWHNIQCCSYFLKTNTLSLPMECICTSLTLYNICLWLI